MDIWLRRYENKLEKIRKSDLSKRNKDLIINYLNCKASEGIKVRRLLRLAEILTNYAKEVGKDLDKVKEDDLRRYIAKLENSNFQEWTKYTYKSAIKNFYKILNKGELPAFCKFIKMNRNRVNKKLPSDIWTEEEIERLISVGDLFWKCFISVGYESGARLGELLNMKIKDVRFVDDGVKIRLSGKTGDREILLVKSIKYLSAYLKVHPFSKDPDAWLWIRPNGKKVRDQYIRVNLNRLKERAGIKKKANPHLVFRHSRATHLAKYLTEQQMKLYFGWTPSSDMTGIYVHLSGRDLDSAIKKLYGTNICYRCGFPNEEGSEICGNCGFNLLKTKEEIEKEEKYLGILIKLLQRKEVREMVKEELRKVTQI